MGLDLMDALRRDLSNARSLDDVNALKIAYLGKKSEIRQQLKNLSEASEELRRTRAPALNQAREELERALEEAGNRLSLTEANREIREQWQDLTLPPWGIERGARHPLTLVERFFIDRLDRIGYQFVDGPEIETAFRNFDALNIPEHHPARDVQDTFWLENGLLLRSHTSTVQILALEKNREALPIKIISPGKVYRNEKVDASHLANFHQFEGMSVGVGVSFAHLLATLDYIVRSIFSADRWKTRIKPKFYPYTEPSIGVDIRDRDGSGAWITILGAGMVHSNVFRTLGYDPDMVSGFAFGIGVSRVTALLSGVDDMKSLYGLDLRVHRGLSGFCQSIGA